MSDVVQLDGELSKEVDEVAKRLGWNRSKILLECARKAIGPVAWWNVPVTDSEGRALPPEEIDHLHQTLGEIMPEAKVYGRELLFTRHKNRSLAQAVEDLETHVPEAAEYNALVRRLAGLRMRVSGLPKPELLRLIAEREADASGQKAGADVSSSATQQNAAPEPATKRTRK
jgi:hypothetical protein